MSDLADKTLITEADVRGAMIGTTLRINETALVTPLAADLARERHIRLERIVQVWLSTELTEERHRRRIAKIDALL